MPTTVQVRGLSLPCHACDVCPVSVTMLRRSGMGSDAFYRISSHSFDELACSCYVFARQCFLFPRWIDRPVIEILVLSGGKDTVDG